MYGHRVTLLHYTAANGGSRSVAKSSPPTLLRSPPRCWMPARILRQDSTRTEEPPTRWRCSDRARIPEPPVWPRTSNACSRGTDDATRGHIDRACIPRPSQRRAPTADPPRGIPTRTLARADSRARRGPRERRLPLTRDGTLKSRYPSDPAWLRRARRASRRPCAPCGLSLALGVSARSARWQWWMRGRRLCWRSPGRRCRGPRRAPARCSLGRLRPRRSRGRAIGS